MKGCTRLRGDDAQPCLWQDGEGEGLRRGIGDMTRHSKRRIHIRVAGREFNREFGCLRRCTVQRGGAVVIVGEEQPINRLDWRA
jgi:hypothetical protein